MNQSQALYRLQKLESSIDTAKSRVSQIETALRSDEIVLQCRDTFKQAEKSLHQLQGTIKDLELDIAGIDDKLQEGEKILYGGQETNPKLLQERQDEIESLKRRRESRQTELTDSKTDLETVEVKHDAAHTALEEALAEQEIRNEDMVNERQNLHNQMKAWLTERKDILQMLDKSYYKMYKQLKPLKNGIAVALLDGVTCSVCRVEQTETLVHQIQHINTDEVVQCNNCGRILVII